MYLYFTPDTVYTALSVKGSKESLQPGVKRSGLFKLYWTKGLKSGKIIISVLGKCTGIFMISVRF